MEEEALLCSNQPEYSAASLATTLLAGQAYSENFAPPGRWRRPARHDVCCYFPCIFRVYDDLLIRETAAGNVGAEDLECVRLLPIMQEDLFSKSN
ncbi:UNVERIFIED_ORG: hypothetical protein ABIB13_002055 [Arthrobacter sp. UYEF2]